MVNNEEIKFIADLNRILYRLPKMFCFFLNAELSFYGCCHPWLYKFEGFEVFMYCILLVYFPDNSNDNLDPRVAKVDDDNKNVDEKTIKDSDVSESNEIANQIAGE